MFMRILITERRPTNIADVTTYDVTITSVIGVYMSPCKCVLRSILNIIVTEFIIRRSGYMPAPALVAHSVLTSWAYRPLWFKVLKLICRPRLPGNSKKTIKDSTKSTLTQATHPWKFRGPATFKYRLTDITKGHYSIQVSINYL